MGRLGFVAILRGWPLQTSAFRLSEKCRKCSESRTQHLSWKPGCAGKFLAGTQLEPGRKASARTRANARCRFVTGLAFLKAGRCSFLNPTPRGEINRKAAEPMSAFVMFARDCCQSCAAMLVSRH